MAAISSAPSRAKIRLRGGHRERWIAQRLAHGDGRGQSMPPCFTARYSDSDCRLAGGAFRPSSRSINRRAFESPPKVRASLSVPRSAGQFLVKQFQPERRLSDASDQQLLGETRLPADLGGQLALDPAKESPPAQLRR